MTTHYSPAVTHAAVFVLGVVVTLVVKSNMPSQANLVDQTAEQVTPQGQGPVQCTKNEDCPGAATVCSNGSCELLETPVCTCSQPNVLQCASGNRARHTFCANGCTGDPPYCL